jgi:hypothetical protein
MDICDPDSPEQCEVDLPTWDARAAASSIRSLRTWSHNAAKDLQRVLEVFSRSLLSISVL